MPYFLGHAAQLNEIKISLRYLTWLVYKARSRTMYTSLPMTITELMLGPFVF